VARARTSRDTILRRGEEEKEWRVSPTEFEQDAQIAVAPGSVQFVDTSSWTAKVPSYNSNFPQGMDEG